MAATSAAPPAARPRAAPLLAGAIPAAAAIVPAAVVAVMSSAMVPVAPFPARGPAVVAPFALMVVPHVALPPPRRLVTFLRKRGV